jgi:hypothetical protein
MVATLVPRNVNEAMVGSGRVCVWQESRVKWSVFLLVHLAGTWLSRHKAVSTFHLLYTEILYFCTSNVICKDITAINYTTVQYKKVHSC